MHYLSLLPKPDTCFSTLSRSLFMKKSLLIASMALGTATLLFATETVAPKKTDNASTPAPNSSTVASKSDTTHQMLQLTLEELAAFNGQNGKPAYVAVDGIIYDETNVKAWVGGKHKGYSAGTDISAVIKKSPHGASVLKKRTVVGKIIEKKVEATVPANSAVPAANTTK